ncbi:MAG: hypothetical protein ABIT38_12575 [Gemmatimonadaceae bacterium]
MRRGREGRTAVVGTHEGDGVAEVVVGVADIFAVYVAVVGDIQRVSR